MKKKEWIIVAVVFLLSIISLMIIKMYFPNAVEVVMIITVIISLILLFILGKTNAKKKVYFILITHFYIVTCLVMLMSLLAIKILTACEFTSLLSITIALMFVFIISLGVFQIITKYMNKKIIKENYITNELLEQLKNLSNFLTFFITIFLLINTTLSTTYNTKLKNLSETISTLELYFSSDKKTLSKDANFFQKNTNDNLSKNNSEIEEHILVIEEYIIEKEKYTDQNKLSFAEYIKNNNVKISKIDIKTEHSELAKRVQNIENYLLSNESSSFIYFSNKNKISIFSPYDIQSLNDYYYLLLTMIVYVLASYYLFIPFQKKDTEKEEINTSSTNNKNSSEEKGNVSFIQSISSITLGTILFLFITNHDKKD